MVFGTFSSEVWPKMIKLHTYINGLSFCHLEKKSKAGGSTILLNDLESPPLYVFASNGDFANHFDAKTQVIWHEVANYLFVHKIS